MMMPSFNSSSSLVNGSNSQQNCDGNESNASKISKLIALSVVVFTSLVGNTLIIVVFQKHKDLRRTINYFIVNMAISDVMIPLTLIPGWLASIVFGSDRWLVGGTLGLTLCKLVHLLTGSSLLVSIQSLIWIAIDRFIAVVFPMKARFISSNVRVKAIISTWILAVAFVVPSLLPYNNLAKCERGFSYSIETARTYDGTYFLMFLILPLFVITILYSAIALALKQKSRILAIGSNVQRYLDQRKKRAVKMSFCVIAAAFTCYLPVLSANLLDKLGKKTIVSCWYVGIFLFTANIIFFFSSTVNPLICFTFVGAYRRGLKEALPFCRAKGCNSDRGIGGREQITLTKIRPTRKE